MSVDGRGGRVPGGAGRGLWAPTGRGPSGAGPAGLGPAAGRVPEGRAPAGLGDPGPLPGVLREVARSGDVADAVRDHARPGAGTRELLDVLDEVGARMAGVGPDLVPVLADQEVTDVLVNGGEAWVDRGRGLERLAVDLGGEAGVRSLAVRMAAACGRRLDDACPIVDGTLPGGVRLHAVLPPLAEGGTAISLRTSRVRALTLADMVAAGTVAPGLDDVLRALVARRASVLVSGATGSGKTTLLATLLGLVPAKERIVCIEEVSELRPDHPHVVHLQERRANIQGAGAVTLADLVRAAMRMRPDRLVLGECRGAEVRDVLTALNTGHDGGWATIHANAAQDVPARLAALGALAGMGDAAVAAQGAAAFDAVVQMRRGPGAGTAGSRVAGAGAAGPGAADRRAADAAGADRIPAGPAGGRRVCQIGVLGRDRSGALECRVAVDVTPDGRLREGPAWSALADRFGLGGPPGGDLGTGDGAAR